MESIGCRVHVHIKYMEFKAIVFFNRNSSLFRLDFRGKDNAHSGHRTGHCGRIDRVQVSCVGDHGIDNSGQVKPVTYKIDTCRFVARCSALLGQGKDWLALCQDNLTE